MDIGTKLVQQGSTFPGAPDWLFRPVLPGSMGTHLANVWLATRITNIQVHIQHHHSKHTHVKILLQAGISPSTSGPEGTGEEK